MDWMVEAAMRIALLVMTPAVLLLIGRRVLDELR